MRSIVLVCLIAFVVANDYELLQQMTQFEFGKTILATLQIELSSENNSIDHVVDQLRSIQMSAQQDMEENSASVRSRSEQCNQRYFELNSVIEQASAKRGDDERTIPLKEEELTAKSQQLSDKNEQESRNIDRIAVLDASRKEEKIAYEQKRDENVALIGGLKKAKGIISQLKSSFLQTSDVKARLNAHLESLNKSNAYYGLIVMLSEAADNEQVSKVVQIMEELIESIEHLQQVDLKGDEQKYALYLQQRARFELENKTLEGTLATLRADVEQINQKMLELQNDIESKNQLINGKQIELADWTKTCDDELKNGQRVRQQKSDELNIINECLEIFTSRFNSGIQSYVQKLEI